MSELVLKQAEDTKKRKIAITSAYPLTYRLYAMQCLVAVRVHPIPADGIATGCPGLITVWRAQGCVESVHSSPSLNGMLNSR